MSPSAAAWVLHNPRRLIVVVALAVAATVIVGWLVARGASSPGPVPRSAGSTGAAPGAPESATIAEPSGAHEDKVLGPAARRTLAKFLAHYLAPTTSAEIARLRPLVTRQVWAGLSVADPKNMPSGPARSTILESEGSYSATYVVRLPEASIRVDVVSEPAGPKVASIEPVEP